MSNDLDDDSEWLTKVMSEGENVGRSILVACAMQGRGCIYKDKSYMGPAKVLDTYNDGERIRFKVLTLGSSRRHPSRTFVLDCPADWTSMDAFSICLNAGYGINGIFVHHPAAIAAIEEMEKSGGSTQDLLDAINHRRGLSKEIAALQRQPFELPRPTPGLTPRMTVTHKREGFIVQLKDLPAPLFQRLAWHNEAPMVPFIGACLAGLKVAPDLMQHLVACDRLHRKHHPYALPVIEENAELLFRSQPRSRLPDLEHKEVGGASVISSISQVRAVRLLKEVATHCGWEFGLPPDKRNSKGAMPGSARRPGGTLARHNPLFKFLEKKGLVFLGGKKH